MMTVISLRGTNGSGKSYLVQRLMKKFPYRPEGQDERGRPLGYEMDLDDGSKLYLVGRYETACGGCDGIHPYDAIWPRVDRYAQMGHVLFEGLSVSSGYGRIGRASEKYGDEFIFAFMDTPLQKCIDHVVARRLSKGNDKPFDPKNVVKKYHAVELSIKNIRDNHKRRIFIVNHKKAVQQVLGVYYGTIVP